VSKVVQFKSYCSGNTYKYAPGGLQLPSATAERDRRRSSSGDNICAADQPSSMRAIVADVVKQRGLPICHKRKPCKDRWPDRNAVWNRVLSWLQGAVYWIGSKSPTAKGEGTLGGIYPTVLGQWTRPVFASSDDSICAGEPGGQSSSSSRGRERLCSPFRRKFRFE